MSVEQAHGHEHEQDALTFWDAYYRGGVRGTGRANPVLVEVVEPLAGDTALDLGCGEGNDAIWLASRGWRVTAVDVSPTVLGRAAARAGEAGVGDLVTWEQHDLDATFPTGTYDLVHAHYLHSPAALAREHVLQRAARAVAPGGLLLVVGHAAPPPWAARHFGGTDARHLATPGQVLASLHLTTGGWSTERLEVSPREGVGPDGETVVLIDSVVAVRRSEPAHRPATYPRAQVRPQLAVPGRESRS